MTHKHKLEIWQEDFQPCINCRWYACLCNGIPFGQQTNKELADNHQFAAKRKIYTKRNVRKTEPFLTNILLRIAGENGKNH